MSICQVASFFAAVATSAGSILRLQRLAVEADVLITHKKREKKHMVEAARAVITTTLF